MAQLLKGAEVVSALNETIRAEVAAIAARGLKLVGWVANCIDPAMSRLTENRAALEARLAAPLLGTIPAGSSPEAAARLIRW